MPSSGGWGDDDDGGGRVACFGLGHEIGEKTTTEGGVLRKDMVERVQTDQVVFERHGFTCRIPSGMTNPSGRSQTVSPFFVW
jgi:hypothetical protein